MNTAILLLTVQMYTLATSMHFVPMPVGTCGSFCGHFIHMQSPGVTTIPPTSPSQIHQESRHYEGGGAHVNKNAAQGSGNHDHTSGGSSVGHHESGKSGHELKETVKKEEGSHKGDKAAYTGSSHGQKGGKEQKGHKHHGYHKGGKKKKGRKMSKGFHEEYHKDEKKSKSGHWKHEHTDGKYIKFGKKRGKGGAKDSKKSEKVEKRNDDGNAPKSFDNMDQLMTVLWSTNGKPVYKEVNHSYSSEQ